MVLRFWMTRHWPPSAAGLSTRLDVVLVTTVGLIQPWNMRSMALGNTGVVPLLPQLPAAIRQ